MTFHRYSKIQTILLWNQMKSVCSLFDKNITFIYHNYINRMSILIEHIHYLEVYKITIVSSAILLIFIHERYRTRWEFPFTMTTDGSRIFISIRKYCWKSIVTEEDIWHITVWVSRQWERIDHFLLFCNKIFFPLEWNTIETYSLSIEKRKSSILFEEKIQLNKFDNTVNRQ